MRPITYESDNDPGGASDALGIHCPHECPQFTQWPNEADWLDAPVKLSNTFLGGKAGFFWERRKPLYWGSFCGSRRPTRPGSRSFSAMNAWAIPAPEVKKRAPLTLTLEMRRDGKADFQGESPFIVWPRPRRRGPSSACSIRRAKQRRRSSGSGWIFDRWNS